jgi:hypothetical protein
MASIHQIIELVVVSAPAPLVRETVLSQGVTKPLLAKGDSLHRTSEPCHLSLVKAVAVLGLKKRGGEAWTINPLGLPADRF